MKPVADGSSENLNEFEWYFVESDQEIIDRYGQKFYDLV
jgi:hypothetical protein